MTNTSLSRTLAEAANLISNSTSQEKIAEFIISDKKRFYVRVTKHPTNKNALLVTSSIDSPSSGGSPRQISKSDFMSFIKSYDKDNVGPKGKEHYYVDYDDGTYQFKIGETWQKLFLGNSMSQLSPTARIAHIGHTYPKINSYHDWLQAISKSAMNEDIEEAAKASPLEDEFLTDLTNAQIAAIKPLMKSKNWDKLKAYLMSQKIVDKDFNNITKYKMDRDILSVLQRSFMDYHEQVENVEEGASGKWARTTPLDSRAWGLNQLPAGVDLQKILKLISDHPSRDVNAKTDIKKAAAALAVDIKKIAGEVGNPDAKTIDAIALAIIRHDMVYAFPGGSIAVSAAANARGIYSPLPPIKKSPGKYAFHSWIGMEGTKASLQEDEFITESTIEFMLDKKVVLRKRIKDAEVRRARDEWIKFGVLPYESNKEASEKYRKPWKVSTKFVPSGINQGPGYKAGQQRDAVIKESVEHVEEQRYIKEYIELLESALESIAEEIGCSVEDLLVEIQTPQRTRQLRSIIDKAERSKKPGGIGTPEYSDKQYNSTKSGAKKLLGYRKAEEDEKRAIKLFNKEVGSEKLYGKGGQVIKRKIRPNSDTTNG